MADTSESEIGTECLCKASTFSFVLYSSCLPLPHNLCHCNTCRYTSGTLCTSYAVLPFSAYWSGPELSTLTCYKSSATLERYFCTTCGSHMFAHNLESGEWEIATGAITQSAGVTGIISHVHVSDTRDGGFSDWLPSTSSRPLTRWSHEANTSSPLPAGWREAPQPAIGSTPDTLNARCHCIAIRFSVSRPTTQSSTFTAPWPDLIVPYFTNPSGVPTSQEKWWLRSNGTKYLAGTCTCRSCRVAAGNAEVVEWAFVPACNISITDTDVPSVLPGMLHREGEYFPKPLHTNIEGLTTYRSSDHATRHFCATCGASVFWSSPGRPELIDVAVGLFDAPEGARAEGWLEWWTERVSFGEEAEAGERDGGFVGDLIEGLRLWEEGRGEREEEARVSG